MAKTRDEAGLKKTELVERAVGSGAITVVDPTLYSVAASDTGRAQTLTGHYRPHIGNYDLLVRSTDTNGREQSYALQVRSTVRYLANGVVVRLPEEHWETQLAELEKLIVENGVLERDIEMIDLRYPDNYVFKLHNGDSRPIPRRFSAPFATDKIPETRPRCAPSRSRHPRAD